MNILVVDVGGTHVKLLARGQSEPRKFDSGPDLNPGALVHRVREHVRGWKFDVISLGYPGRVGGDGPEAEPGNLGDGWVGFDFAAAFGVPVRVVNDAVLQALGGYTGGRMLFLGLGTGLGSALVAERVVIPLELGCLPAPGGEPLGDRLDRKGLETRGEAAWAADIRDAVGHLRTAFAADDVVLGGGNAARVRPLPAGTRRGGNDDAFAGGFRLWTEDVTPHDHPPTPGWRVVR